MKRRYQKGYQRESKLPAKGEFSGSEQGFHFQLPRSEFLSERTLTVKFESMIPAS